DKIKNSVYLGVGQFSSPKNNTWNSHDGNSGRVLYPTVQLSDVNRDAILQEIVKLNAWSGTPSAAAYAESAAYMLGKKTYGKTNSGYSYSHTESRNGNDGYKSPLSGIDTSSSCNGQGIYFLTDGFANNNNENAT